MCAPHHLTQGLPVGVPLLRAVFIVFIFWRKKVQIMSLFDVVLYLGLCYDFVVFYKEQRGELCEIK